MNATDSPPAPVPTLEQPGDNAASVEPSSVDDAPAHPLPLDQDATPDTGPRPQDSDMADDTDRIAGGIDGAALKALESGKSETWHKDELKGYVVVRDPQAYPNQVCRNVVATVLRDQDQTQSSTKLWCQPANGGEWQPRNGR